MSSETHVIEGVDGQVEFDGTDLTVITRGPRASFPASEVASVSWKRATNLAPGSITIHRIPDEVHGPIAFDLSQQPRMQWLRERLDPTAIASMPHPSRAGTARAHGRTEPAAEAVADLGTSWPTRESLSRFVVSTDPDTTRANVEQALGRLGRSQPVRLADGTWSGRVRDVGLNLPVLVAVGEHPAGSLVGLESRSWLTKIWGRRYRAKFSQRLAVLLCVDLGEARTGLDPRLKPAVGRAAAVVNGAAAMVLVIMLAAGLGSQSGGGHNAQVGKVMAALKSNGLVSGYTYSADPNGHSATNYVLPGTPAACDFSHATAVATSPQLYNADQFDSPNAASAFSNCLYRGGTAGVFTCPHNIVVATPNTADALGNTADALTGLGCGPV